jgi:hypothetical protein
MVWVSPQLSFYSKDGTIESVWTGTGGISPDTVIRVAYLDDKQCKPYGSYDCLAVFNQKQITNCKLIGEFWVAVYDDLGRFAISDLNLGVKEIEGQYIILSDGTITCQPPNGNWRNGIGAITGSYTVYDANNNPITIDCDNKVFISKYKTANYDCNSLFQTRGIQNFKVVFYSQKIIAPTQMAIMPSWDNIINAIIDWLKSLFSWFKFEIYGEKYPSPGSKQVYKIVLNATPPDTDYSDGTFQIQYASWVLVDRQGNIINKGDWEQVNGSYAKQIELTIPSNPDAYVIVVIIYQYNLKFNTATQKWEVTSEGIVAKEAMDLTASIIAPPQIQPPNIFDVIKGFWCWLIGLFGLRC